MAVPGTSNSCAGRARAWRSSSKSGDGHAGQGDGEVDITAIETSLIGTFQFIVRKDMHLKWPRAETPTHYMTMGLNDDLNACATLAVREMIDFLVTEKHLSRDDAYISPASPPISTSPNSSTATKACT